MYDEAGHLLGEYGSTGTLVQETIWLGDTPVATIRPNGASFDIFYVHTDHLNQPRKVTNTAALPVVRWTFEPNPFGDGTPNENPAAAGVFKFHLRFPGQYFDIESNLAYNYFRDYDSAIGRYVESDPIGQAAGVNTYGYVSGNPVWYVDPYGLWRFGDPLPQGFVDYSAGLGDALLWGFGDDLRDSLGIDGGVDPCSKNYKYGSYSALAAGTSRLAYAGLAKTGSILASSGAQASAFRAGLKDFFRGGVGRNWRPPNLDGLTDAALRRAAGRTNPGVNIYGGGIAAGAAADLSRCECRQ